MTPQQIAIISITVLVCAVWDLHSQRIPNLITFPVILGALCYQGIVGGWVGFGMSFLGLAMGLFLFSIPFLMSGMGAGDAKLLGAVGAWVGPYGLLHVFLYTAIGGAIYAVIVLALHPNYGKKFFSDQIQQIKHLTMTRSFLPREPKQTESTSPKLCYGLAIAAGTFTYIAESNGILSGYF